MISSMTFPCGHLLFIHATIPFSSCFRCASLSGLSAALHAHRCVLVSLVIMPMLNLEVWGGVRGPAFLTKP